MEKDIMFNRVSFAHWFCDPEQNNQWIGVTIDGIIMEYDKVFTVLQKLSNSSYHDT